MPEVLPLQKFFNYTATLIDVRSPSEFKQGHIPGSHSIPLFSDEERALIGTVYKQEGQTPAIHLGLKLVGPKLCFLVESASDKLKSDAFNGIICWRGGMRSGFFARLLESIGFKTCTLQGGYRSFRRWVLQILSLITAQNPQLILLGGLTGSGKTVILKHLQALNEQVINLEELAQHHGSVFGHLGKSMGQNRSQEQFENELAYQWAQLDMSRPIWIEDESRLIGKCHIPNELYQLMKNAPLFYIECQEVERIKHLMDIYGNASAEDLIQATQRIMKKLGSQLTQEIINLLLENQKKEAFKNLLMYYDKSYILQLTKRQSIKIINKNFSHYTDCANYLKEFSKQVFPYEKEQSNCGVSHFSR